MKNKKVRNYKTAVSRFFPNRVLLMLDIIIIIASYFGTFLVVADIFHVMPMILENIEMIIAAVVVFAVCLYLCGIYRIMWVLSGTKDFVKLVKACILSDVIVFSINYILGRGVYMRLMACVLIIISTLIIVLRLTVRGIHNLYSEIATTDSRKKRLMIIGAGNSASILMRDIASNENLNYDIVCLIDDSPDKQNTIINGVKVVGNRYDIISKAKELEIDEIILAAPAASVTEKRDILEICNETDCEVKTIPSIDQVIGSDELYSKIRKVNIDDLLAREPIVLDNPGIEEYIKGKTILVTGGGGSIGSELCRQIMKFSPGKLVIVDIYENNAYDLQMELNKLYPDNKPEVIISSVRDYKRLEQIFDKYRPYIVFHAAAHKHVPLMETTPGEAIKNNVFGTLNAVKCADKYGVKRFVMISTDKAVNPTNIMGATKRICEMIVQSMRGVSKTEFVAVRFGNVLGSNGSVIPLFKKQIEEGGPVTVTDKRITRFFMTIPEAARLVLQAASYAKGGEIFVLDMGKPVKIYDLAKNLIRLSGFKPGEDIEIVECGLRPGEKLYEELLMSEEGLTQTAHNKIFIGKPIEVNRDELKKTLDKLETVAQSGDVLKIRDAVAEAVPTYVRPENSI